jgi:hypothetical protein
MPAYSLRWNCSVVFSNAGKRLKLRCTSASQTGPVALLKSGVWIWICYGAGGGELHDNNLLTLNTLVFLPFMPFLGESYMAGYHEAGRLGSRC